MLQDQVLLDFLELALRGFTVRRIRELMSLKGHNLGLLPDAYLVNLIRDNAAHLEVGRNSLDGETLKQFGLASKLERVRRLCEAAESMEALVATDSKWSGEYRRYLEQIRGELEPLGITFTLSDSWAQLMTKVAEAGRATTVDKSDVETTETPD